MFSRDLIRTIVEVEDTVDERVDAAGQEHHYLRDHVDVDERLGELWRRQAAGLLDDERDYLDDVVRQLTNDKHGHDCQHHSRHVGQPANT